MLGSIVPSCVQLKTSASSLYPRCVKVSPLREISIPKLNSLSDKATQAGCHMSQKMAGAQSYPKWLLGGYSEVQQTVWLKTHILNKDSWTLLTQEMNNVGRVPVTYMVHVHSKYTSCTVSMTWILGIILTQRNHVPKSSRQESCSRLLGASKRHLTLTSSMPDKFQDEGHSHL